MFSLLQFAHVYFIIRPSHPKIAPQHGVTYETLYKNVETFNFMYLYMCCIYSAVVFRNYASLVS